MEITHCPLCKGQSKVIDKCSTINPDSDLLLDLRECEECKHWFIYPIPSQEHLNTLYQTSSPFVVPHYYPDAMRAQSTDYSGEKVVYDSVLPYSDPMKNSSFNYLEIGIGSGHLFHYIGSRAKVAYGVEPGPWVIKNNERVVKDITLIPRYISFDVIIANDVLEHVVSPLSMLKTISEMANPGSVIHCTFPNKDSLKARLMKKRWDMIRPYGHLHYFSAKSIQKIFNQAGFEIVKIKNVRKSYHTASQIIKNFNYKEKNILYRLVKSLLLGQLLLGKDQWQVIARRVS